MGNQRSTIAWLPALLAVIFVLALHMTWLFSGHSAVPQGGLFDGDSFMRLVRVERLLETGNWLDVSIPRANAPFGTTLHWTRPLDALILLIAGPMAPFLGFKQAIYLAGVVVGPVTHVLAVLAIAWAAAPMIGRIGAALAGALTPTQPAFMDFASFGRADHHSLLALFIILAFGFSIRALCHAPYRKTDSLWAGFFLAASLWIGPEAYAILALCLTAFGLPWLLGEKGFATKSIHLCLGFAVALSFMLVVERGFSGALDIEYDRLSILHLTVASFLLLFWFFGSKIKKGIAPRAAFVMVGLPLMGSALWILYPGILQGPMVGVDPEFFPLVGKIAEFSGLDNMPRFLIFVGGSVFALPWTLWRMWRAWGSTNFWTWAFFGLALVFYLVLSVVLIRGSLFAGIFLAIALADLIVHVDINITRRMQGPGRVLAKVTIILILAVGPLFVGLISLDKSQDSAEKITCPLKDMAQYLNQPPWSDHSRIIVASANFGPEILYRTNHAVLASLHHRGATGIIDGMKILGNEDEKASQQLAIKRQVDLILLCPDSGNDGYFLLNRDPEKNLYKRLIKGEPPAWLKRVDLPAGLKERFHLFQVTKKAY